MLFALKINAFCIFNPNIFVLQENVESCVKSVVANADNDKKPLDEASSSKLLKNTESVYSDSIQTVGDLLLTIPQFLLQQERSSVTVSSYTFIALYLFILSTLYLFIF